VKTKFPLRVLDFTFGEPALNLALDEVLLERAEHEGIDTLRFWESPVDFVVLGSGQVLRQEVFEEACAADGVAITRRCTAGGCVLQGPGSLNFSLALRYSRAPELRSLHQSYCVILNGLAETFARRGHSVHHRGICDLALGEHKVSGNAQRRKRNALLHHGTLLYRVNAPGMSRFLQEPADRPDYRSQRTHDAFVHALPHDAAALRHIVCETFNAGSMGEGPTPAERQAAETLAGEKYRTRAWTYRR